MLRPLSGLAFPATGGESEGGVGISSPSFPSLAPRVSGSCFAVVPLSALGLDLSLGSSWLRASLLLFFFFLFSSFRFFFFLSSSFRSAFFFFFLAFRSSRSAASRLLFFFLRENKSG